jgi:hypothetical protein
MLVINDATGTPQQLNTSVAGGVHTPIHTVGSSALPTGAATDANLQLVYAAVQALASALPLPTGAATDANLAGAVTQLEAILAAISAQTSNTQPVSCTGSYVYVRKDYSRAYKVYNNGGASVTGTSLVAFTDAPAGAGTVYSISDVCFSNAGGTATLVQIYAGSTAYFSVWLPAGATVSHSFEGGALVLPANTAIGIICSASTTIWPNIGAATN